MKKSLQHIRSNFHISNSLKNKHFWYWNIKSRWTDWSTCPRVQLARCIEGRCDPCPNPEAVCQPGEKCTIKDGKPHCEQVICNHKCDPGKHAFFLLRQSWARTLISRFRPRLVERGAMVPPGAALLLRQRIFLLPYLIYTGTFLLVSFRIEDPSHF